MQQISTSIQYAWYRHEIQKFLQLIVLACSWSEPCFLVFGGSKQKNTTNPFFASQTNN